LSILTNYFLNFLLEINSNFWNSCSNVENLTNESSAAIGGYTAESYAVSDSVDSYSSNLSNNPANNDVSLHNHTYHQQETSSVKARTEFKNSISDQSDDDACISRDEKRAKALGIPISIQDIINLPIDEFNERLAKYELTEVQLSLIRDIRRRGKNKVAAQNCRRRKMDQIIDLQGEVERLYSQKKAFQLQHEQLIALRHIAREKYTKLYDFIVSSSASQPVSNYPTLSEYSRILVSPSIESSSNRN
jgi:segmentation protein cap'n'collar